MSIERVRNYFEELGMGDKVHEFAQTTATVEEAAVALGCAPELIAKTMSFIQDEKPMIIVTAGDAKIDNKKYKSHFQQKAKMIPREQVEELIGHAPGGVCPFAIDQAIPVYLINECTGSDIVVSEKEEVVDMCKGLEGYGKKQAFKMLVSNVENMMKNLNWTLEAVCSAIGSSVQEYEEAKKWIE